MSARIFLAGVAVGAIVGGLAVFALRTEKESTPIAEGATTAAVGEETTARTPEKVAQSAADPGVPAAPAPARTAEVVPPSSAPALPGPGTTADVAPAASSADPGDEVLRMDAEMRARGESLEQLADKLKTESRDDGWAPNMENELRDYLARRPVPNALGSTSVQCRTTVCRIVSVVHDDALVAVPHTDLQAAIGALPDESLGREVVSMGLSMMGDPKQPGQTIEMVFLRRADEPSNSSRR